MRAIATMLLAALALVQGWQDWQATIGHGYAWRFTPLGQLIAQAFPEAHAGFVSGWQGSGLAWDPVGKVLMALPVAPLLAILSWLVWITRRRRSR